MRLKAAWVIGLVAIGSALGCSSDDKELGEGTGGTGTGGTATGGVGGSTGGAAGSGGVGGSTGGSAGTGATGATGGSGGSGGLEDACIKSGGTVSTALCCGDGSNEFPNSCLIGACGCAPENSSDTKVCDCPSGMCWDGTACTNDGGLGGAGGAGGSGGSGGAPGDGCVNSGGTIVTQLCCQSSSDFPNTCAIGACGCSPSNSHDVKACSCPTGKCFDGASCI